MAWTLRDAYLLWDGHQAQACTGRRSAARGTVAARSGAAEADSPRPAARGTAGPRSGKSARESSRRHNVALVVSRLAQSVTVLLGVLIAITVVFPSFQVVNLIQLLGITSVAIGFAFRDILQNFLAGILILWTEPFRIGDQVAHGNIEGTVEDIQTRATLIKTHDGRPIVVPNAQLFTSAVTVNTAFPRRRVEHELGIGPDDDLERTREVILDELRRLDGVLDKPPPDVRVVDLGDFAVRLRIRWWIEPPRWADVVDAKDEVLQAVKRRFASEGISLPFPTTRVLLSERESPGRASVSQESLRRTSS
jgi:small conductance mechanosensitive channel